jgi:hypothetical protein
LKPLGHGKYAATLSENEKNIYLVRKMLQWN